jgi:hypothetical protein
MLDISPIVAGIICQIGTGTFGKAGEASFNPAMIPRLATKYRLCCSPQVSSLMYRDTPSLERAQ